MPEISSAEFEWAEYYFAFGVTIVTALGVSDSHCLSFEYSLTELP